MLWSEDREKLIFLLDRNQGYDERIISRDKYYLNR